MIFSPSLLHDLRNQVAALEEDLRKRSEDPQAVNERSGRSFEEELKVEYHRGFQQERTAATYEVWRDERVTQAAVAWVLATVFVRFCEDNRLLEQPFITGPRDGDNRYDLARQAKDAWITAESERNLWGPDPTDRGWLVHAFDRMSDSPAAAGLFDRAHNPMWSLTPSRQAAENLIAFWRRVGDDGHLVHDFTDPDWDTRFLGDLYQDLSEEAQKNFALLQTPEFVEEFILDYTLEPAIREFGLNGRFGDAHHPGFRMIDPVCGSGRFLLGAFHRLLEKWRGADPAAAELDLISRSLRSVHGVDKNPFAVAITRFRLLIAAMKEGGITALAADNPAWPILVATGDSLIHGRGAPGRQRDLFGTEDPVHRWTTEDVDDYTGDGLLRAGSYHAVVGNPPYTVVKDKRENEMYQRAYADVCSGRYALSVPFAKRFFDLAEGEATRAGFVGQITANSFMKREFGKRLVEGFFDRSVHLTHIVDTSGAYIPGHGIPTVILFGRNRTRSPESTVRTVRGIRGEPVQPESPARGVVWQAIADQVERPGSTSTWVSVEDLPWENFQTHPWNLSGGKEAQVLHRVEGRHRLKEFVTRIGYIGSTGSDDVFTAPAGAFDRVGAEQKARVPVLTGSEVGDWATSSDREAFLPWTDNSELISLSAVPGHARRLWPYRTLLQNRTSVAKVVRWYAWNQTRLASLQTWSIVFRWVATHADFALLRGGVAALNSAPVIELGPASRRDDHFGLLAVLNSSTACFWLKQMSNAKSRMVHDGSLRSDDLWEAFYEFTGTRMQELPLPDRLLPSLGRELDELGQRLAQSRPQAIVAQHPPTRELLDRAHSTWTETHGRMVALQEELDWESYRAYGLGADTDLPVADDRTTVPELRMGERAFEIVFARRMKAGDEHSGWFTRHGITPITEAPSHWPDEYRDVVERRIAAIEFSTVLGVLERPEYKRRWVDSPGATPAETTSGPWEKAVEDAVRRWLLNRCEDPALWFAEGADGRRPVARTVAELARLLEADPQVLEAAEIYRPQARLPEVILELLQNEHVPHLAALRFKEPGLRKYREWEHVWSLQAEEDALAPDQDEDEPRTRLSGTIPVPPRYRSSDFRKPSYWAQRGKLDVPGERFTSYAAPMSSLSFTSVIGWAGWDAYERARILVDLIERNREFGDTAGEHVLPLLAGLQEVLPWVKRTGRGLGPLEPVADSEVAELKTALEGYLELFGLTHEQVRAWAPPAPRRGRPRKNP